MLLIILVSVILILLHFYFRRIYSYWEERGVKYVKPIPIFGNMWPLAIKSKATAEMVYDLYNAYPNERYIGFFNFTQPILMIRDPNLIRDIAIKYFEHFTDHVEFVTAEVDPLWGNTLISVKGEKWKDLRQTVSPVFTGSKMRQMFTLMDDYIKNFIEYFKNDSKETLEFDPRDTFARCTNDIIATTAFGVVVDSMRNKNNEFYLAGLQMSNTSGLQKFKMLLGGLYPKLAKFLRFKIVTKRVGDFFSKMIRDTIRMREEQNVVRPDLIHLLMQVREGKLTEDNDNDLPEAGFAVAKETEWSKSPNQKKSLTDLEITAQVLIFFIGGYHTSSSAMIFLAYELAVNPEIQTKLRQEIINSEIDEITYEKLFKLKYLDMVVSETLRKWQQCMWIDRRCTKEFTIEPKNEGERPVTLNVDDIIWMPYYGIQHDPKYFSDPEKFDPERFNNENKTKINPYTYGPFGHGPRNCIGSRFALMEIKLLFYYLLRNFEIVPVAKTQIPLKLNRNTFFLMAEDKLRLGLKPL